MKIAIIGAGWYGCHIALELRKKNINVEVFEAKNDIFEAASMYNQNRLHLGYHYPRSYHTRMQAKSGYNSFKGVYGDLTYPVRNNLYAIHKNKSLLDFDTYKQIMYASGLECNEVSPDMYGFQNLSGVLRTEEMLIDASASKDYFKASLDGNLRLGEAISDIKIVKNNVYLNEVNKYDYVINCTWGAFKPQFPFSHYFQACLTLLYECNDCEYALTVMDGDLFSLYPYKDKLFTLTHVDHTHLDIFQSYADAQSFIDKIDQNYILDYLPEFEGDVIATIPDFKQRFRYKGFYTSIKTKPNDLSDSRQAHCYMNDRKIDVFSGKIDTVFHAMDMINIMLDI